MGYRYDAGSGHFISQKHQDIATIIHDYNPELELRWIPPERRSDPSDHETPFALYHCPPGKPEYLVMLVRNDEVDERLLERIFLADMSKNDVYSQTMAKNMAAKLAEEYAMAQQREELAEFHSWLLKSPLNTVRHGGRVYK